MQITDEMRAYANKGLKYYNNIPSSLEKMKNSARAEMIRLAVIEYTENRIEMLSKFGGYVTISTENDDSERAIAWRKMNGIIIEDNFRFVPENTGINNVIGGLKGKIKRFKELA
jgi:hypothetical protein